MYLIFNINISLLEMMVVNIYASLVKTPLFPMEMEYICIDYNTVIRNIGVSKQKYICFHEKETGFIYYRQQI